MCNLFNSDGDGGREISERIGLISTRVDYELWKPILPLGVRDVKAIIGPEPVDALADFYAGRLYPTDTCPEGSTRALTFLQQAVALFTWLKIIPTLDAQHDNTGRARRLGENEKGLTALEQYKDEANVQRLAYEAVDALIEEMELRKLPCWLQSAKYKQRAGLLIRSKEIFDQFYCIGSHRLFVTLLPIIREVQTASVLPVIGRDIMQNLLEGDADMMAVFYENAARAVALLSMMKAVERLPVEVLPEGVVQVNQSAPVAQRLKAEKSARESVAAALSMDASRYLQLLEDSMIELRAASAPADLYVPGPIIHSKGFTF